VQSVLYTVCAPINLPATDENIHSVIDYFSSRIAYDGHFLLSRRRQIQYPH